MSIKQDLNSSPLFQGIHEEDCRDMLSCFQAVRRSFRSEEVICDFSSDAVGIMESGEAVLIRIDVEGVSTVLENLGPGSVFGRPLAFAGTEHDSLEVLSCTPCGVIFIDHDQLFKRCRHACQRHNILLQNMLKLTVDKAQALSRRVDVLSRRCIREKLLCCFPQRPGGLHSRGPQRHDAGAQAPPRGGRGQLRGKTVHAVRSSFITIIVNISEKKGPCLRMRISILRQGPKASKKRRGDPFFEGCKNVPGPPKTEAGFGAQISP